MTSEEVLEQMENEEVLCDYYSYKHSCKHKFNGYVPCEDDDLTELIDYLAYCEDRGIEMNEVPNLRSL